MGGGHFWALPAPMLASHGHLTFGQGSGLVVAYQGRIEGVSSAQIELDSAQEAARKQRGGVCWLGRLGPFLNPAGSNTGLPRPPGLRPRQRLGCSMPRASQGRWFSSTEIDLAPEAARKQRGAVCCACVWGAFLDPAASTTDLPRAPGHLPRQRPGCSTSRASQGRWFSSNRARFGFRGSSEAVCGRVLAGRAGAVFCPAGAMLASHGHPAFDQGNGLVAAYRGRVKGVDLAQIELDSAPGAAWKQRGCVCWLGG